jgi:hypothetical protein
MLLSPSRRHRQRRPIVLLTFFTNLEMKMAPIPENRTCRNETATARAFPQLSEDLNVDIAIIGGGIEGLQPRGCSIDQVAPP